MNDATNKTQQPEKAPVRRAYHAPALEVYGTVRGLTASGTLGVVEAGSASPNKRL
jgi:hypothetical protein